MLIRSMYSVLRVAQIRNVDGRRNHFGMDVGQWRSSSPITMTSWLKRVILVTAIWVSACLAHESFPMLMPHVQPKQKETYLCTGFKMPKEAKYIVEFTPNATMHIAHHILIYGCITPGYKERDTPRTVWDCGEMSGSRSGFRRAPTCASGSQVIYAWARDAPPLTLPEGVGFKVGGTTDVQYLVLQVHYANVDSFLKGATDNSGIVLTLHNGNDKRIKKRAGVLLLGTGGEIPRRSKEHMETACKITEPVVLHPFAFRTHTHKLGKVVAGYVVRRGDQWQQIGKRDPLKPQMFYPVKDKNIAIHENDVVAARCTMENYQNHDVYIGSTADDEMCNFYMMYYVDGDRILNRKYCFSAGPPMYYWRWDSLISNVPDWVDREASTLKDEDSANE